MYFLIGVEITIWFLKSTISSFVLEEAKIHEVYVDRMIYILSHSRIKDSCGIQPTAPPITYIPCNEWMWDEAKMSRALSTSLDSWDSIGDLGVIMPKRKLKLTPLILSAGDRRNSPYTLMKCHVEIALQQITLESCIATRWKELCAGVHASLRLSLSLNCRDLTRIDIKVVGSANLWQNTKWESSKLGVCM